MEILTAGPFEDPEDGFGLQQAILEEVASGGRGPAALVWSSSPYVGATRPETRMEGFARASRSVEALGFPVLVRNSGGGAVAANGGSLSFSLTLPVEDLRHGLYERYAEGVGLISSALRRVGVEAEGGEVEGEFCPGAYSVRSGGWRGVKYAGLAQRVTRRAARLEALVLVEDTGPIREALARFYGGLGLPFRPSCVADLPAGLPDVVDALSEEVRRRYGGRAGSLGAGTLGRARERREGWRFIPETGSSL